MILDNAPLALLPEAAPALAAALAGDVSALSGFGSRLPPRGQSANAVAVIPITGVIAPSNALAKRLGGTSVTQVREDFDRAMADPAVHAIALHVNSPGGYGEGVYEVASHILANRGKKPIVAHVEGMAGSAAYWLASSADRINASSPLTNVGSIGVYATHVDVSKALDNAGIKLTHVTAGKYKAAGASSAPLDEVGRGEIQRGVDAMAHEFSQHVAKARGMSAAELGKVATGRVHWGAEAKQLKLIDTVGSFEHALGAIKPAKPAAPAAKAPPADVAARARVYIAAQAKLGRRVSTLEAIEHVSNII